MYSTSDAGPGGRGGGGAGGSAGSVGLDERGDAGYRRGVRVVGRMLPGLLALVACQTTSAPPPGSFEEERVRRALEGREWFSLGFPIADREPDAAVDDGVGLTLDGGYELTRTAVRPSIEAGGSWSGHDVDGTKDDLDAWRVSMGFRVALHELGAPVLPYARGGTFYRWSDLDDGLVVEDDGWGWYWGLGLDFLTEPGVAFGPFFTSYEGVEEDLEERFFGFEAVFRF